jgi:hypothetical protein
MISALPRAANEKGIENANHETQKRSRSCEEITMKMVNEGECMEV